jgi:hypothetical protein
MSIEQIVNENADGAEGVPVAQVIFHRDRQPSGNASARLRFSPRNHPYSHHFPIRGFRYIKGPLRRWQSGKKKSDKDHEITAEQVVQLRHVYDFLIKESAQYDLVATFALGGIAPLIHVTHHFVQQEGQDFEELQQKFHLFPGLNWGTKKRGDTKNRFKKWLTQIKAGKKLLIFDTGNDGNGVNQAFNIIKHCVKQGHLSNLKEVRVVGIVTRRLPKKQTAENMLLGQYRVRVRKEFLHVPAVPFEDASHFIGYESLKDSGSVRPLRSTHTLIFVNANSERKPFSSANVADVFHSLFREDSLTSAFAQADDVYDVLKRFDIEPDDITDEVNSMEE